MQSPPPMSDANQLSVPADGTVIPLEQLSDPMVIAGVAYWRSICAERKFPAREALTLRGLAPVLTHCVTVRVIDEGADFEFRFVGDSQRQAFKVPFKGVRVSQIAALAPELGALLRGVYEAVRAGGFPFAVRGSIDFGEEDAGPVHYETAFLPLGADDAAVDHILIVGVQVPGAFWEIPDDKLRGLAKQIQPAA